MTGLEFVHLQNLERRLKDLEDRYFLIQGIVTAAKEVVAKHSPDPLKHDYGLAWEEWKLYVAIEEYENLMKEARERSIREAEEERKNCTGTTETTGLFE